MVPGRARWRLIFGDATPMSKVTRLVEELLRQVREQGVPQAKQNEGFKGMIALGDCQSGKTMSITFWENEEAMRASEEAANRMRSESAQVIGQERAGVERYEVGYFEVES